MTKNEKKIGDGFFTLRVNELNDNIILKDVKFLNTGNGVDSNSLKSALELLVISRVRLVNSLLLSETRNKLLK